MSSFAEALKGVAARVPETQLVMVMGTDGIPIEKLVLRADPNMDAIAAEYTTLLRASVSAAADTGLGTMLWNGRLFMLMDQIFLSLLILGLAGFLADRFGRRPQQCDLPGTIGGTDCRRRR